MALAASERLLCNMMIGAVNASPEPSLFVGNTSARRVGKPDDVSAFLVQNSLIFAKQKGSHQAAVDARSGSPEPRKRSIDRCAAAEAPAVALEAASRGCPHSPQPWAPMTSISTTSTSTDRCGNQTSDAHAIDAMLSS